MLLPVLNRSKETALAISCLNNVKEISLAIEAYTDENNQYFPQVTPSWSAGPYINQYGNSDGGEWTLNSGQPNTIGPLLSSFVKNNLVWVCPKRKRGSSYINTTTGQTLSGFDPSVTGFLSYGFNEIGVFGGPNPVTGVMNLNPQKFKAPNCLHPADVVTMCDCSGSINPKDCGFGGGSGVADGCWLDTIWAGASGPRHATGTGAPGGTFDCRVQTAEAKHDNRLNFLFVDGHAALTYASRIVWGQFYGIFGPTNVLNTAATATTSGLSVTPYQRISNPGWDSIQWSAQQEY